MKERTGKCMYYYVVGVQEVVVIVAVFAVSFFIAACAISRQELLSLCSSVVVRTSSRQFDAPLYDTGY